MKTLRGLWIALFLLCCHAVLFAQSNCYETQRQKGIQLYNQGEYSAAYKNFETAKLCTDLPSNNDLDSWMEKCVIHVRLSVKDLVFEATDAEPQCVDVSTNAKTYRVGSTPDWCSISQQGKTLTVVCRDNMEVASRSAKIQITAGGKSAFLEIFQRSADVALSMDPEELSFSSSEEKRFVLVRSNVTNWQVASTPSWIVAEKHADSLLLTASKNSSALARDAQVMVSVMDEQFVLPVRQYPGDTVISTNVKELRVPSEANTTSFAVSSNMQGWTVDSSEPWMKLSIRQDSVIVSLEKNYSVFSRHGRIVVRNGRRSSEIVLHQYPNVSNFVMPPSELKDMTTSDRETVQVTSFPSELRVYVDDSIGYRTPFSLPVDYEHHSLLMGFERREYFFNDKLEDVSFSPGFRFASFTYAVPKTVGLMTGFVGSKSVGAFSHFQLSGKAPSGFADDTIGQGGYHLSIGPVYCPLPYLGIYAGIGCGIHNGYTRFGFDWEAGVMGFYKHVMLSMGVNSYGTGPGVRHTGFMIGVGGYLKQYYDTRFGYCGSDSRRWWSVNYVFRPAENGHGVMFSDLGAGRVRAYLKGMYLQPDTCQNVDMSVGVVFTPVNGIIDLCVGAGSELNVKGMDKRFLGVGAEVGVILNIWRIPITIMAHELDIFGDRRMCFDFGFGFHFGDFKRSSYK